MAFGILEYKAGSLEGQGSLEGTGRSSWESMRAYGSGMDQGSIGALEVKVIEGLEGLRNLGNKKGSAGETRVPKVGEILGKGRTKESRQTRGLVVWEGSQIGLRSLRGLRSLGRALESGRAQEYARDWESTVH